MLNSEMIVIDEEDGCGFEDWRKKILLIQMWPA